MLIHHLVTILLLTFSWACNFVRIGTLVLVIHDFADVPLEGAKVCRYIRASEFKSNCIFGIFTLSWIFSRLGLLPYRVISYTSWHGLNVIPIFPAYYVFNTLLVALQILHVIWTILILKIAYNAIYADGVKDLREDSSLSGGSTSSSSTTSTSTTEEEEVLLVDDPEDHVTNGSGDGLKVRRRRRVKKTTTHQNQSNANIGNNSSSIHAPSSASSASAADSHNPKSHISVQNDLNKSSEGVSGNNGNATTGHFRNDSRSD